MGEIAEDIERVFEHYNICKTLVICSDTSQIERLMLELKEHDHSVSTLYNRMNTHVIRWNMNRFLTNHTRVLLVDSDMVAVLNRVEYDSIWEDINFIVCIDLTEDESSYWLYRHIQHKQNHYIHLYQKEKEPQYYIVNV
jgi:hypothetical protein